MRRRPVLGLGTAIALVMAPASQADNAATPPPPKSQVGAVVDAYQTVNTASGLLHDGAMLAAPPGATASKFFQYKADGLAVTKQIVDVTGAAMRGDVPGVVRSSAAAIADRCVDLAIDAVCAATGPAAPGCVVGVQAVRFCGETYYGTSVGEGIVMGAEKTVSWVGEKVAAMRGAQDASRQQQQGQFQAARSDTDQAAAMGSNQQGAQQDDGSAMMVAAMMGGVGMAIAANDQPPVPYRTAAASAPTAPAAIAAQPTGCHPGHDESAHPGGCHDASRGGIR